MNVRRAVRPVAFLMQKLPLRSLGSARDFACGFPFALTPANRLKFPSASLRASKSTRPDQVSTIHRSYRIIPRSPLRAWDTPQPSKSRLKHVLPWCYYARLRSTQRQKAVPPAHETEMPAFPRSFEDREGSATRKSQTGFCASTGRSGMIQPHRFVNGKIRKGVPPIPRILWWTRVLQILVS